MGSSNSPTPTTTTDVTVDLGAGFDLNFGTVGIGIYETPLVFNFGSAEGVLGHRLAGLSEAIEPLIDAIAPGASFDFANYAVKGARKIVGSLGNDHLTGNATNETFDTGGGNDVIDGRDGSDTVRFGSTYGKLIIDLGQGVAWSDATLNNQDFVTGGIVGHVFTLGPQKTMLTSIENVTGLAGNDLIIGTPGANRFVLEYGSGSDVIYGMGGDDILDLTQFFDKYRFANPVSVSTVPTADGTEKTTVIIGDSTTTLFGKFEIKRNP